MRGERERGLLEVLFEHEGLLNHTGYGQPALYAMGVAIAELLKSWGQEPEVVVGHSVGQYAAAVVAGVLGLEEGLRLIAKRGELMGRLPAGGGMAAVYSDLVRIEAVLEVCAASG
jgi:acyl transferase domain-containing protein